MALAYAVEAVHEMEPSHQPTPTLHEIHESLDIPGARVEIIRGRVIVSPTPSIRHGRGVLWLVEALREACVAKGWDRQPQVTLDLPATDERFVPDLLVFPGDKVRDEEWLLPAEHALLAVEVVSPSSRTDDYGAKAESYSTNGVPLCLIVDPLQGTLTLCAEPGENGYGMIHRVNAGEKLDLPEPFGIALDTSTSPLNPKK